MDIDEANDPHAGQVVLLTVRLLEDDEVEPGFVAYDSEDAGHPVGDDRQASGWELYVGDETDDELEDPDNARLTDLAWALDRFPQLQVLVDDHDAGRSGAWLATEDGWVELDDEVEDGAPEPPTA